MVSAEGQTYRGGQLFKNKLQSIKLLLSQRYVTYVGTYFAIKRVKQLFTL